MLQGPREMGLVGEPRLVRGLRRRCACFHERSHCQAHAGPATIKADGRLVMPTIGAGQMNPVHPDRFSQRLRVCSIRVFKDRIAHL